ncbi:hypothetical protein LB505_005620 [Fusarium chuoi]|nr:hypothetical protein LB503_004209 [Fusarium chuoi]KAI1041410.1 hypothetical protein LB505_005620 [Fusarium chuoi]
MSFMLSGRQRLLDEQPAQAGPMIKVQEWLTRVSRDILDESDYTLAVRTQLIYPSGAQTTVDGHPHRWLVVEAVLRLVDNHLYGLFLTPSALLDETGAAFPLCSSSGKTLRMSWSEDLQQTFVTVLVGFYLLLNRQWQLKTGSLSRTFSCTLDRALQT